MSTYSRSLAWNYWRDSQQSKSEDARLISLIRRWLKANILEEEELHANEEGTPQGGSISVLLSNLYLPYGAVQALATAL